MAFKLLPWTIETRVWKQQRTIFKKEEKEEEEEVKNKENKEGKETYPTQDTCLLFLSFFIN